MNPDDLILDQIRRYEEAIYAADAELNTPPSEPPTSFNSKEQAELTRIFALRTGWKVLPEQPTRSISDKWNPKTSAEKAREYEAYIDPNPLPTAKTFYRCVNKDMELVEGDVYQCAAQSLNSLMRVVIPEPTFDTEGSV